MSRSWQRVLGLMFVTAWLATGCNSAKRIDVGGTCILNSDCNGSLVCTMGKCHDACHTYADCPAGQPCTKVDNSPVCLAKAEAKCAADVPCGPLLICATDLRCRSDCNAECLSGQLCVQGVCAWSDELDGKGQLVVPDAGAYDALLPVSPADVPIAVGGPEAGVEEVPDAGVDSQPDVPASPADGSVAPTCGTLGVTCCAGAACSTADIACSPNLGICVKCGVAVDLPCCAGDACSADGTFCVAGTCKTCGGLNQPCCADGLCNRGPYVCSSGSCASCGGSGQPCCGGGECLAPNAICESGTCCGSLGDTCCAGGACLFPNSTCSAGRCQPCGGPNAPC